MNAEERKEEETPSALWATWALVKEARKVDQLPLIKWIIDRLEAYDVGANAPGPVSYLITTNGGHWARGKTLVEAAKTILKYANRTEKANVTIVINDATPEINSAGYTITESVATHRNIGVVGTIGSILNANKE